MSTTVSNEDSLKAVMGANFKPPVRDYAVTFIVGNQGVGKSALMKDLALDLYSRNRCKMLILDVAGARSFEHFKAISFATFKKKYNQWTKGIIRLSVSIEEQEEMLNFVSEKFTDGILFIDEMKQLQKNSGDIPAWAAKIFLQCRNRRTDVYCAIHKFKDIHINTRGHIKSILIFPTPEIIETPKFFRDLGFEPDIDELFAVYQEVMNTWQNPAAIIKHCGYWFTKNFKGQVAAQKEQIDRINLRRYARDEDRNKGKNGKK